MKKHTTSAARAAVADIVNRAEYAGGRTVVHRRKKPVAAVIPIEDLKLIEQLEDEIDIIDARKAMREKGKNIPWEQIKRELNPEQNGLCDRIPSLCPQGARGSAGGGSLSSLQSYREALGNPHPPSCKKLKSTEFWRIRAGHRVIYAAVQSTLVVVIVKIGHRREVYR